jgi:hypothetical protein
MNFGAAILPRRWETVNAISGARGCGVPEPQLDLTD